MHHTHAHLKVIALYYLFSVVMIVAVWLVYDNTNTLIAVNRQNEAFVQRRNMADSLVYSLLEVNNAERSLCLGVLSEWDTFDSSLQRASAVAQALKANTTDARQRAKIDTLTSLIAQKRTDMLQILATVDAAHKDNIYAQKVHNLQKGRDSVVIHPQVNSKAENRETVYQVVKTRRTFFARLADAFRKQRTDTVEVTQRRGDTVENSLSTSIDIADTVADLLTRIQREEASQRLARQHNINQTNHRLQLLSVETANKTEQLLKDISGDERLALQTATAEGNHLRLLLIVKIVALAAVAVVSALVLMILVWRDIRRQEAYSKRLEQANAETERLMNQRERLLLTITHDIKAPAASISGFTELLSEYVSGGKGKAFLENIHFSATHLLNLVGELLDYHSLEKGKTDIRPIVFSLRQLVEKTVAERRPQTVDKGITLTCNVKSEATLRADAFRIKQVLDNLLSNAIKFTDSGTVDVTVELSGDTLRMSVSDTGRGMDADEQQTVFNAFTRLPSAQGTEGVGLGLAIVQSIVKLLGGQVSVKSEKGVGSVFSISIPVERAVPKVVGDAPENSVAPSSQATATVSVLVVDDDKLQLTLLREMFARLAPPLFRVSTATCAAEARRMVAQTMPDVMLIDIEMPDTDGETLQKSLRHSTAIAMTAHNPDIEPRLHAAGFKACLFKPFTNVQLAQAMSLVTGLSVQASACKTSVKPSSQYDFSSLTAFADGDKEAERQILQNFRTSLNEAHKDLSQAIDATSETVDRQALSQLSHKLTPTLSVVAPPSIDDLQQLYTHNISSLSDAAVTATVTHLIGLIDELLNALNHSNTTAEDKL